MRSPYPPLRSLPRAICPLCPADAFLVTPAWPTLKSAACPGRLRPRNRRGSRRMRHAAGPAGEIPDSPAPDDDALRALAAVAFGLHDLRDGQLAGMAALAAGRDVLAVMPTGYGKSALYQVPALLLHRRHKRPTVVVSPLISLQEDQLDGLAGALGQDHAVAVAVNSSHSPAEQERAWQ